MGMFDVHHSDMAEAVLEAAEERKAPVILALAEVHAVQPGQLTAVGSMLVRAAERAGVPVAVHLDHAVSVETAVRAMELGFSSVMYDGSALSLEENLENTAKTVRLAGAFGASVEAELGHVGGEEGNSDGSGGSVYTKPEDAAYFAEMTGADALAVSIGTVHGRYREKPNLNIPLLEEIHRRVSIPLVLHGGSGLSDQDFKDCIAGGISKINIYTEKGDAGCGRRKNKAVRLTGKSTGPFGARYPAARNGGIIRGGINPYSPTCSYPVRTRHTGCVRAAWHGTERYRPSHRVLQR